MKLFGITFATGCAMLAFAASAPAFDGPDGRLTQLNGGSSVSHACLTDDGSGGACVDGRALAGPTGIDVAISPDGGQVYTAGDAGIAILQRDFASGALMQSFAIDGCVTASGAADGFPCVSLPALGSSYGIAVSPDGLNVYATSQANGAVLSFARNPLTGALTPLACTALSPAGVTAGCADGRALDQPRAIAVSRDGQSVYVTSHGSDAVSVFARGPGGVLTQLSGQAGCVSDDGGSEDGAGTCGDGNDAVLSDGDEMPVTASPDNASAYVAGDDGLLTFSRGGDGSLTEAQCLGGPGPPPGCTAAEGLADPSDVAVAPDGAHVYATSPALNSLAYYSRGAGGLLSAPGACLSAGPSSCGAGNTGVRAMASPAGIGLSADRHSLYVASGAGGAQSKAIAAFGLDSATGRPLQLAGTAACTAETPGAPAGTAGCEDGKALTGSLGIVVAPDGNHLYSAAISPTDGLAAFGRTDPPDTTISVAPKRRTKRHRVRFGFLATEPAAYFSCKVDKKPTRDCESPFKTAKLKRGRHSFQVYAVDASGQADPTPAVYPFRVRRGKGAEADRAHRRSRKHSKHSKHGGR